MSKPREDNTMRLAIDPTNPGQFFACCGLLELADRLWPDKGAAGWFEGGEFCMCAPGTLDELWRAIVSVELEQLDPSDDMASPMRLSNPFDFILDWWKDDETGGRSLKVWAGSMRSVRIAQAMKAAVVDAAERERPLDYAAIVYDPYKPRDKVEPFYYDSRRGWNAQPIDIGFSPNALDMKTTAYPAVEFLCVVGLQRFRPRPTSKRRVFDYSLWHAPLTPMLAAAAAAGVKPMADGTGYRFENAFRTDQKKHKSFLPATPQGASR